MQCSARVASNGAILLGCNVAADGAAKRPLRVVTHAHQDHTRGLARSVKESLFIVATNYTFEVMDVLGLKVPVEKRMPLSYGQPFHFDGETITLVKARHIIGSAQVVVESRKGHYGYTGDFKMPGTKPLQGLDVLVIDATYGSPRLQRRWGEWDAIAALMEIIERFIGEGPVWIYGYHGKLQEVMAELRVRGINYEFLAEPVTVELARIASRFYGVEVEPLRVYTGGVVRDSVVVFVQMSKKKSYRRLPGIHVVLTGWELRAPAVLAGKRLINVSFSDHASFKEIIEYVDAARPRKVVVDATRGKDAWFTAKYIERILGIPAEAQPRGREAEDEGGTDR